MTERRCPNPEYGFEFICKVIEPTCELFSIFLAWTVMWRTPEGGELRTGFYDTPQETWQAAFQILDRRKAQP